MSLIPYDLLDIAEEHRALVDLLGYDPNEPDDAWDTYADEVLEARWLGGTDTAWWRDEPLDPEQEVWECLMLSACETTVREAPAVFDALLAMVAEVDADVVPY